MLGFPPRSGILAVSLILLVKTTLAASSSWTEQYQHPILQPQEPPPVVRALSPQPVTLADVVGVSGASNTLFEPAEDLDGVSLTPASPTYPMLQTNVVAEGDAAFHLAHPAFTSHIITLNTPIIPETNTQAFFESQLRYATTGQVARFEVSETSGSSWTTLWE